MANYYKQLCDIPEEKYFEIIVDPMLNCLRGCGVLIDTSKTPKTYVGFDDAAVDFFLLGGGSVAFWWTTAQTVNTIDNSILDRMTLITVKGIPQSSGFTEETIKQTFVNFSAFLAENGYEIGQIT